ncbi:MAG: tandem-95 repeat protein, partial [Woeseia sp.]|nr:tandem-95 repeat protein [Woeseia sp.]
NNQNVSTNEDTALPIVLNATDGDGDTLTYSIISNPTNRALSGTAPSVTYTPNLDYNGPDSFTFRASDATVDSNTATISITVNTQNDAPTATQINNQSASEGVLFSLNVTSNFDDVDGDALTYTSTGLPTSLELIGFNSGVIDGTPTQAEAEFNSGVYNVTVTARDPSNATAQSSFTLTIGAVNDAPVANNQNVSTNEDTTLPIVLDATDGDGDALTYSIISNPTNGLLSGTAPSVAYTPNLNFNGTDSFSFAANDGTVSSTPAIISITVDPANDLPILVAPIGDQQAVEAASFSLSVAGNFTDPDNEGLTYSAVGLPASLDPINPGTGVIDGTPTQAEAQLNSGVYNVTVTATDGSGEAVSDLFQLLVVELTRANVMLSVTASPTPAMLNDQIQFNFLVRNNGPALATNIELNGAFVGSGLTVTPSGATTCTVEAPANQVTNFNCIIGNLNVLASTSLAIMVTSNSPGAVTLAATAAASTPVPIDPDLTDNSAQFGVGVAEFFSNGAAQILGNARILAVSHGDLNNDGATDIVLGTIAGLPAQVFLSGGFRDFSASGISMPDSSAQQGVALADFDGDGFLDVVLANANAEDRIYRNDGTGTGFTLWSTLPGGTLSNDVAAADFNGDGNMDVLVAANGGNPLFLGNGSGGFTLDSTLGNANSRAVAVGQLTGNNRLDAVFANVSSGSTLWNNIGFSVNSSASRTFNFGDASSVVIAELIGGSNANAFDIAFGRIPTDVGDIPGNLVWSNNGSGGLSLSLTLGSSPTNDILAGDVSRDGQNDLVFVNDTGVHQIWNRSGNTFELHSEQIVADNALSGVVADLGLTDVDTPGGVDLAMGGNPTRGAGVFLNDGFGNLGRGDITPPTMTLNSSNPLEVPSRTAFSDPGVLAVDNIDGDISSSVIATGTVNTALVGSYTVTYNITDSAGNPALPITRTVNVTPSTGTGGGGGGTLSPFAVWFLIAMVMVSSAGRRVYISKRTNKKNKLRGPG